MTRRNRRKGWGVLGLLAGLAFLAAAGPVHAAPAPAERLATIRNLLREGGPGAGAALRTMAATDPDLGVREQAILALAQVGGPEAIPALVEIAVNPPDPAVAMAAFNSVHVLRERFPLADPPQGTIKALSPLGSGREIQVEATVVSPVDRPHARIRLAAPEGLRPVREKGEKLPGYQGPLQAGKPVTVRATFLAEKPGLFEVRLTTRVSLDRVDATTYATPLYLDLKEGSGSASTTPPVDPGKGRHPLVTLD
ncbi:MAG TPA: HEAT repeat domain-containing protein [Thermoanaerobaculia bacterium]|nr:HEAT repeat domain-containing protein [Thermoanaerobaculia bacterium]